jgi:Flp pilus assembly pilin Flp
MRINSRWFRINQIVGDTHAQDLIEYALLAGFLAVAAGAFMPGISNSISGVFSAAGSVLTSASS